MTENTTKFEYLTKYGLTFNQYECLLEACNNACMICGESFEVRKACLDHDHKSGDIRGLLCIQCNAGLGMFQDKIRLLAAAIVYLQDNGAR